MIKFTFYSRNCKKNIIKFLKEGDKIWINNFPRTVKRAEFCNNGERFTIYFKERLVISSGSLMSITFSKNNINHISFEYKFIEEPSELIINRLNNLWVSFDKIKTNNLKNIIEKASNRVEDFSRMSMELGIGTNSELINYNLDKRVIRERLGLPYSLEADSLNS